jgi:hypothetical protein
MGAWRWHLLIIACLAVLLAPTNYFAARYLIVRTPTPTDVELHYGRDAAKVGYAITTPLDQPSWPAPTQVQIESCMGYRLISTWSGLNGQTTHQTRVEQFGWPLPVFVDAQFWWPWDERAWKSQFDPDPSVRVNWPGIVLNPPLVALAIWGAIAVPMLLLLSIKRAYRTSRGACVFCGYPRGHAPKCTECGYTFAANPTSP